jgi:dUTP pyrophosphatase
MVMRVNIKTLGDTPLPQYQTSGAVAFDLHARESTFIPAKSVAYIPTGLIIKVPEGYVLQVCARSSTPKRGLLIPHGFGIIDQDYHGENDEILLQYYNFSDSDMWITKGERVGQAMFVKIEKAEWQPAEKMAEKSRGGFGSTGH